MSNLNLEIISPEGVVFKGQCHMAVIPSVAGDLGVMEGHEALIASLREGQISVYDDKQALIKSFEVKGGFAEVQGSDKLLVLIDS